MPTKKRANIFVKYDIPTEIGTTLGLIGIIILLAFIFPDKDFGIIKTPKLGGARLLPILLGLILIASNFPFFKIEADEGGQAVSFVESKQLHPQFKSILAGIKNEAIFWGGNFYYSVNEQRDTIMDRLLNGVKIRYLIFNPESPLCSFASKDFDEGQNHFHDQCVTTIKNLIDIESEWKKRKGFATVPGGSLEIRLYSNIPRLRAYIIDPQDKKAHSYYVHFIYKLDSSYMPVYKIPNSSGILDKYLESFNKLWDDESNTMRLDEFVKGAKVLG